MIIIVLGLPGSGKSFFASRLARQLGTRYLNSDEARMTMNARGKYTFEDKLSVYRKMANDADQALRQGESIIVDGTFYHHKMRDLFTSLAASHHAPIHFIEITAREEIIKERLAKPRRESEADYDVYQFVGKQFEQPEMPHLKIESDRSNIKEMLAEATNYLKERMHE
jgi:predicted kinase